MDHSPATAVIFDLDGTLVDSEPLYHEAGRRVLDAHGVPDFTWEEHARFIGISTWDTLETLRAEHGLRAPVEQLLTEQNRVYLELARESAQVFPAMRELVKRLHAAGHPLAVASGSSPTAIDAVLAGVGLDALLPVRVSAEDVGRGKPEPDVFLEAARLLSADPVDCVVLEDAAPGVEAALRAGMRCIAVPCTPDSAADPAFASAGLLFADGQRGFDARRALGWITGAARGDLPLPGAR